MRILQLPPEVANQIAAGEVIERPASIAKELLENSLDAQADHINIDIGFGGLNQVKISDNGFGIVAEDLPLAIAAHATSKITALKDLYAISSMGFRGEALASIASIARVNISSKPASQENGMMLECRGSQYNLVPIARNSGTTIDVRDIFFNAPVRKKFLKSERAEFLAIDSVVRRFALAAPGIAINLNHNGKSQLQLPQALDDNSRQWRMIKLLGKAFVETSFFVDAEHGGMHLYGWVSGPEFQRSQNDRLWVYINGRMVRDKLINHAIKQAYESLLYPGRNPACLLYLTINPELVDVNVHPTKHEVRFQEPRLVHDFISSRLSHILNPAPSIASTASYSSELQLRDSSDAPKYKTRVEPVEKLQPLAADMAYHWTMLNQRFAIVVLDRAAYLVDAEKLQRAWMLASLQEATLPLPQRPLLVPVHIAIPSEHNGTPRTERHALHQVGIDVDYLENNKLAIHSLPVLTPNLDIKSFFVSFFNSTDLSITSLLELLTKHQTAGSMFVNNDMCAFLQSMLSDTGMSCGYVKHLSEDICQDILDDK